MIFFFNFIREKKLTFLNTQVELSGQKIQTKNAGKKLLVWWLEKLFGFTHRLEAGDDVTGI